jgi:eukaryotic-like serine/threonine-protein kinase
MLTGRRIGVYQVEALLGAGGMGEVYRARDTKLGREVAIKILPHVFTSSAERLARFEREARVLAALNHPHVAAIYGVEEAEGLHALVLELVQGDTLADRLLRGPVPVAEALAIARQIADALDAAHEKGIVHRDLKPANIKVTPDGVVKVLDFGLAKVAAGDGSTADLTQSPTVTAGGTEEGVVLGTAAYMSPEQARGKAVDKRTDIWAFGCVVYELLTGRRPFARDTISDTIAAILERDVDFAALPPTTPPAITRLLQRCLEKDTRRRLRDIGDARAELELPAERLNPPQSAIARPGSPAARRWLWPAAAVLSAGLVAPAFWLTRPDTVPAGDPSQFTISIEDQAGALEGFPAPSPDGRYFAFVGGQPGERPSVWVRALDAAQSRALPGTEGASQPVWSPDSRWVAFYADGRVKKISPSGGPPQTIADVPGFVDAAWGARGDLIFRTGNRTALFRIREGGGGPPEPLTTLDQSRGENSHRGALFLPGGQTFLYTSRGAERDNNALYLGSLDSSTVTRLMPVQSVVRYIQPDSDGPGAILYHRDGGLVAQRFDPDTHELSGDPVPVVDQIEYNPAGLGLGFEASRDGRVAVLRRSGADQTRLTWFARTGEITGTLGEPAEYLQPRISPDGSRVAFTRPDDRTGNRDVWVMEIARAVASRLTTHVANDWFPVWSPNGRQLLFGSDRDGGTAMRAILKQALDATSEETPLSADEDPMDWSRDGKWVVYKSDDVVVAPAGGKEKSFPFLATPFREGAARFSPDAKWIAYASNESGRFEVYVRPFAGGPAGSEGKLQISNRGGDFPVWRADGQELFYMAADYTIYSVKTTDLGRTPPMPSPSPLFRACPGTLALMPPTRGQTFGHNFDTLDGTRFLVNCVIDPPGRFVVLLNWPLVR